MPVAGAVVEDKAVGANADPVRAGASSRTKAFGKQIAHRGCCHSVLEDDLLAGLGIGRSLSLLELLLALRLIARLLIFHRRVVHIADAVVVEDLQLLGALPLVSAAGRQWRG